VAEVARLIAVRLAMDFLDELEVRALPGDGAMGTLLMERGIPLGRCFEELSVSESEMIRQIHGDYIAAGARVIETNTFGANAVRLAKHGLEHRVGEINWTAAQLARAAARAHDVYVAGSVGPLGITAEEAARQQIDRTAVFNEQIGSLLDGGAQLIFLETFLDLDELLIALEVKQSLHHCPAICSLACNEEGRLPTGMHVRDAFARLRAADADVVGLNCVNGPHAMTRLFEAQDFAAPVAAFPNAGHPQYFEGRFLYFASPEYFAESALRLAQHGARLIGGCCGTGPSHVAAMAEALRDFAPYGPRPTISMPDRAPVEPVRASAQSESLPGRGGGQPDEQPTLPERVAQGRTVVIAELDPPKTLELDRFLAGARALHDAGCDAVTLADNSLAILRVSNLATGALLKERFNITPLLHLSCRDHNVIGLQSTLLGMSALGIRHVLPLTGDPAKVGDHPGASSVYDVTSIELLAIIRQLNAGMNANGKSIRQSARLVAGCTFNPGARNLDAQCQRLARKIAAGAQFVMTQPVFDREMVVRTADRLREFQIPVFPGIWPLLNARQAEFLHNEVPGISIPDAVRAALRAAKDDHAAGALGMQIARDMCEVVLEHFPGVYLITPFLRFETTVELAGFVRSRQ
jgi:homocysteine S-methyltransferase